MPGTTATYRRSGNVPGGLADAAYKLTIDGSTVKAPNGDAGFGSSSFQWLRTRPRRPAASSLCHRLPTGRS